MKLAAVFALGLSLASAAHAQNSVVLVRIDEKGRYSTSALVQGKCTDDIYVVQSPGIDLKGRKNADQRGNVELSAVSASGCKYDFKKTHTKLAERNTWLATPLAVKTVDVIAAEIAASDVFSAPLAAINYRRLFDTMPDEPPSPADAAYPPALIAARDRARAAYAKVYPPCVKAIVAEMQAAKAARLAAEAAGQPAPPPPPGDCPLSRQPPPPILPPAPSAPPVQ